MLLLGTLRDDGLAVRPHLPAMMIEVYVPCIEGCVFIELLIEFCLVRFRHWVLPFTHYLVVFLLFEALVELLEDALVIYSCLTVDFDLEVIGGVALIITSQLLTHYQQGVPRL